MFGERLRGIRESKKLTQKDLGKKIGVAENTISGWESEDRSPSIEKLRKLAIVLDVSVDYLLGITPEERQLMADVESGGNLDFLRMKYDLGELSDDEVLEAIKYIKAKRIMEIL